MNIVMLFDWKILFFSGKIKWNSTSAAMLIPTHILILSMNDCHRMFCHGICDMRRLLFLNYRVKVRTCIASNASCNPMVNALLRYWEHATAIIFDMSGRNFSSSGDLIYNMCEMDPSDFARTSAVQFSKIWHCRIDHWYNFSWWQGVIWISTGKLGWIVSGE